jgi:hypothetical protein
VKAIAGGFNDLSAAGFHCCSHKVIVASKDSLHGLGKLLLQLRTAFQICKQKGQCR